MSFYFSLKDENILKGDPQAVQDVGFLEAPFIYCLKCQLYLWLYFCPLQILEHS